MMLQMADTTQGVPMAVATESSAVAWGDGQYEEVIAVCRRFARSLGLDPDDLANETAVRLVQKAGDYDPVRGWGPWVEFHAGQAAAATVRQEQRFARELSGVEVVGQDGVAVPYVETVQDHRKAHEDEVDDADELEHVLAHLDRLPPESSQVLRMVYGVGNGDPMTYEEVAAALGIGIDAVRVRLIKAIDQTRRLLGLPSAFLLRGEM